MCKYLKPLYHFSPPENWMNDPNGLCFYYGEYHLFYQHNPYGDRWGTIHWGHAKSRDLINWEHLPIALYPSNDLGELHCYSGCCVVTQDGAQIFYTSIGEAERGPEEGAQQWSALSRDGLLTWEKLSSNPFIDESIHGELEITFWRDPFIWRDKDDSFLMLLSGTNGGNKGCILLYRSLDLEQWEFVNLLYESEEYPLIECPAIIPVGEEYILLYSPRDQVHYLTGHFDNNYNFITLKSGIFDGGSGRHGFYSPNVYLDLPDKRKVLFGWLSDIGRLEQESIQGWAGVQSLPREVTLEDGDVVVKFAKECDQLIGEPLSGPLAGRQLYIEIIGRVDNSSNLVFTLLANDDESEATRLKYYQGRVTIERSSSTLFDKIDTSEVYQELKALEGELKLRLFLDASVVEVEINNRYILSARIYPSQAASMLNYLSLAEGIEELSVKGWSIKVPNFPKALLA